MKRLAEDCNLSVAHNNDLPGTTTTVRCQPELWDAGLKKLVLAVLADNSGYNDSRNLSTQRQQSGFFGGCGLGGYGGCNLSTQRLRPPIGAVAPSAEEDEDLVLSSFDAMPKSEQ
uniref:Uncharacterized protein n=1 Tax=Leersia perrieri TaxID=77586 RepID=A0A0D9VEP0_9ORYZ